MHLVTGTETVAADHVGEQATVGAVIDFALGHSVTVVTTADITIGTAGSAGVAAVSAAVESTQVGFQHTGADRQVVQQADKILLVEIVELAVVVLQRQVVADFVIATGVVELVAVTRTCAAAIGAGD
ncbi:hypothetical protein D9M71_128460 [compost metagenome]